MNLPLPLTIIVVVVCTARTSFAQSEPKLNQPTRPGASRSADIQRRGVLQVEIGLDGRLHSPDIHSAEDLPFSARYAALQSLALDVEVEPLVSQVDQEHRTRQTAFGDTVVGGQWVAREQSPSGPALALAYDAKLPTASDTDSIGTGRVDHRLTLLATKKIGQIDVDANVAYLNVGRRESGRTSGAFAAVSASQEFTNNLGYILEWSHQTEDAQLPRGGYALAAITYRLSEAARLDVATRVGLTRDAPDVSVTAGVAVSAPLHIKQ